MSLFPLKPTHAPVKAYYAALTQFEQHGHTTEGNTRSAFADLLKKCCNPYDWHLVEEYQFRGTGKQPLRADGALIDKFTLQHGIWEAKDTGDDLRVEIRKKVAKGYPILNTLFQSPTHAILYQDSRIAFDGEITTAEKLVELLELFFQHKQPDIPDWKEAVEKFSAKIADLAGALKGILDAEHKRNPTFRENFSAFADLCRQSINPDLSEPAIQNMLIQHLLTERVFTKVFNNPDFLRRNVIAVEIEKVITSITAKYFTRDEFLKSLDPFYKSIEKAAEAQESYTEKQHFLNAVYEKFFQNFDKKQADTHGIVYTPQPIVDFMVRSVEEILQQEFGKSLSDRGVHILDPFTGTGNFITRIMQEIKRSALPHKYAHELHCNEIMLLPYYIASMNIEYAYVDLAKAYAPFEGICLVDTFELAEPQQRTLFTAANSKRVDDQKKAKIEVVIGNPPYNIGQNDENDGNANRKYSALDARIRQTYVKESKATLTTSLFDPYVRAFRWASDRIGDNGVICLVSNNSFLDDVPFDRLRRDIGKEFDRTYLIDLGGNIRKNPALSGTTHNVFGIQVGVVISILVKRGTTIVAVPDIRYTRMQERARKTEKFVQLSNWKTITQISWENIRPDGRHRWFPQMQDDEFLSLTPLARLKSDKSVNSSKCIFRSMSNGVKSNNDFYAYSFQLAELEARADKMLSAFLEEWYRWRTLGRPNDLSRFLRKDLSVIKWIRRTKKSLKQEGAAEVESDLRKALYRPFTRKFYNFTKIFNEDTYSQAKYFPANVKAANRVIIATMHSQMPFTVQASDRIACVDVGGRPSQTFPFYVYDGSSSEPTENITPWALTLYRKYYLDETITKWNIFHATYAVLHHPEYRTRYAANLKRELPRIPFPPDFHAFAKAGKRLMDLHIDYEQQKPYRLEEIEDPKADITFRVEKMKLSKDKSELRYNDFLLLRGIPAATYDYRLGNRSALEWVIDQYRVSTDTRSGIVNDPNREDDPQYILRLIGQVITVSLETQQIIAKLPSLHLDAKAPTQQVS